MNGLLIAGIALMVLAVGCVSPDTQTQVADVMMEKEGTMVKDDTAMEDKGDSMMTKGVEYVPFTKAAYDQAKADGKTIFLEFYANWCPTCKAQHPALVEGIGNIESESLVAFQVNYKDSETDAAETELAKQYNITYQHTHVVTNAAGETLLKSQENWSADDVVSKLSGFA